MQGTLYGLLLLLLLLDFMYLFRGRENTSCGGAEGEGEVTDHRSGSLKQGGV